MDRIEIRGIKLYGYHGCMDEESRIGTDYEVDLCVWADLTEGAETDKLSATVDYVMLNRIVKEEMGIRSKLLETVNQRICDRILNEEPRIRKVEVSVSKLAPPINGDVDRVSVIFRRKRKS